MFCPSLGCGQGRNSTIRPARALMMSCRVVGADVLTSSAVAQLDMGYCIQCLLTAISVIPPLFLSLVLLQLAQLRTLETFIELLRFLPCGFLFKRDLYISWEDPKPCGYQYI